MYHFTYMTSSPSGKYYVGRHSTSIIEDGYQGSGKWVKEYTNKEELKRQILQFYNTFDDLLIAEDKLIKYHFYNPNNMNFVVSSTGWGVGKYNWMHSEDGKKYGNGADRKSVKKLRRQKARQQLVEGTHNFQREDVRAIVDEMARKRWSGDSHPSADPEHRLANSKRCKEQLANGTHNFQKPEIRQKAIESYRKYCEEGNHHAKQQKYREITSKTAKKRWEDKDSPTNKKARAKISTFQSERVTCPHCGKIGGRFTMKRWHFNNCKQKKDIA